MNKNKKIGLAFFGLVGLVLIVVFVVPPISDKAIERIILTPDMTEYFAPHSTALAREWHPYDDMSDAQIIDAQATEIELKDEAIERLQATAFAVPETIIRVVEVTPTPSWGMEVYATDEQGYATSFGDGIWIVGVEIGPGMYRNHGAKIQTGEQFRADNLSWCRWSLHLMWSMRYDTDRIAQAYDVYNVVEITWKDKLFQSHNCGVWEKVQYP